MKRRRPVAPGVPGVSPALLQRINPNAAGVDCGAETHHVAVLPERDPTPVRAFATFTADLHRLADWLVACGVTTVAMESTGVYWIPLYEILEAHGLDVLLVNARHVKHVPGRKTDNRRLPVAAGAAQRGVAARQLPPAGRHRGFAGLPAPPGDTGAERGRPRAAHA